MAEARPQSVAIDSPSRVLGDEQGATSLEWALLPGAIAIPSARRRWIRLRRSARATASSCSGTVFAGSRSG